MNSALLNEAKGLPIKERAELIDELWASMVDDGFEPPLTSAHAAELDRRMEEHRRTPNDVVSWEEMRARVRAKYGWRE